MEKDKAFQRTWDLAAQAICHTTRTGRACDKPTETRQWWVDLINKYKIHPVVARIISEGVRPADWHQLLLEWPHVSTEDETLIAYTRDEVKGKADVQTRTSIGKYLSRHWSHVPDHVRRDWAGIFHPAKYEMRDTMEGIISGVELGPQSCMKSSFGHIPFNSADNEQLRYWQKDHSATVDWHKHPYSVYDPGLGWRMAVRLDADRPDIVMGRALVFVNDDNATKVFVRSYQRNSAGDNANSGSDEKLETWLRDQGAHKHSSWLDGTPVLHMEHPKGGLMMPYLDGDTQLAELRDGYVYIESDGNILCDNVDGTCSEENGIGACEDCGDTVFEGDDYLYAGLNEDRLVCSCCRDSYIFVKGEGSHGILEYHVHDDSSVEVNNRWYDKNNLPDFIVRLGNGDYAHSDDAAYIESQDEYYLTEDDAVCCTADSDWEMRYECVKCADDKWRLATDCVKVDGDWYEEGTEPELVQMALELGETR
jgi:hypothetical protein